MEITGKIVAIYPVQQKTAKFRTREFVLDVTEEYQGETYPGFAVMQAVNGTCDYLDENPNTETARYVVSDVVTVSFALKGYQAKSSGNVYNVLQAYRIVDAPMTYQPYVADSSRQGGSTGLTMTGQAPVASAQSAAPPPVTNTYAGYQQPVSAPGQTFDDLPF